MSNNLSETVSALMTNQGQIKEVKIRKFMLNRFIINIEFQQGQTKTITQNSKN